MISSSKIKWVFCFFPNKIHEITNEPTLVLEICTIVMFDKKFGNFDSCLFVTTQPWIWFAPLVIVGVGIYCWQFSDDSPGGRNGDDSAAEENELTDDQQYQPDGRLHRQRFPHLIIPHYSPFKAVWDWITLLLVLYTAVVTPFMAAFMLSYKDDELPADDTDSDAAKWSTTCDNFTLPIITSITPPPSSSSSSSSSSVQLSSTSDPRSMTPSASDPLSIIDMFVDIMFIADILINFRTTYLHNGEVVSDPRKIAVNYIKSWFLIDAAAAIPFDLLLYGTGSSDVSHWSANKIMCCSA